MSQFTFRCGKMKTVLFFAGLVAFALAGTVPHQEYELETKNGNIILNPMYHVRFLKSS